MPCSLQREARVTEPLAHTFESAIIPERCVCLSVLPIVGSRQHVRSYASIKIKAVHAK